MSDADEGGSDVFAHRWEPSPDAPARGRGVYLLHGMGEHGARYARLAERLATEGWPVGAHDHPGHGRSAGRRGVIESPERLVDAAAGQIERFTAECGGAAPALFGHSLGGVVATELALARRVPVAGLALSAPAIVPRLSAVNRVKLAVLTAAAPSFALELPYDASLLTSDPVQIAAAHADPLIHGYKSAGLVRWLLAAARRALERAGELDVPTLVMVAGDDRLIDTARTRAFAARLPPERLTVIDYAGFRHELLNEMPERRERVATDIVRWLDDLA